MGEEAAEQQTPAPPSPPPASSWPKEVRVDVIDGGGASSASKQPSSSFRLWRVPKHVRDINKEAYGPKFACIGPYHRRRRRRGGGDRDAEEEEEEERRLRVEKLKERYLDELLTDVVGPPHVDDHRAKRDEILLLCTCRLGEMLDSVRRFYAEDQEYLRGMTDEEMVRMLLLDGCFIIKHIYNFAIGYDDPELYATRWSPAQLRIDLGLLENQIPFFVLEEIFYHLTPQTFLGKITRRVAKDDDKTMRRRKRHKLIVMAMWYMLQDWFQLPTRESDDLYKLIAEEEVHHLLHLVHIAHLAKVDSAGPKSPPCEWQLCWQWPWHALQLLLCILPLFLVSLPLHMCRCCAAGGGEKTDPKANIASASQLRGLGVKIRMAKRDRGGILDVRLRKSLEIRLIPPELEVPALSVEEATAVLLQNLVAYEQQGTPARQGQDQQTQGRKGKDYFTTYAFLMYNLVSSTEDIAELQEKGVLLNNFGSHETIINYFKNLCRWNQRSKEDTPIGKVLDQLRVCSQYQLYRDWAEAKKYMDTPVKILALVVSTLLAISTILQTTTAFYPK
ncbi:UPF0481 protein At3g47200-like [Oryza sativa Japonica Group]|uniref:UPF0481 protein At3g47200-like n=1 Tax=Oryza sativa subsp. japonica TaxID=39947 RepID=UPI0001C7D107|nr:UPF0481 protein At3g47200-like [Oryza sativa Japonica Group]